MSPCEGLPVGGLRVDVPCEACAHPLIQHEIIDGRIVQCLVCEMKDAIAEIRAEAAGGARLKQVGWWDVSTDRPLPEGNVVAPGDLRLYVEKR